jgi:hypothetical protein
MKLLRLESDGNGSQSIFTNNLGVPLILAKRGSVALKTLCIDFTVDNIIIDKNNNLMFVTYGNDTEYTSVYLDNGIYNKSGFFEMFTSCLNRYIDSENSDSQGFGVQWNVFIDDNDKVEIQAKIEDINDTVTDADCELTNVNFSDGVFTKSGADNNSFNATIQIKDLMCNGGFYYSSKVSAQDFTNVNFAFYIDSNNNTYNITSLNTLKTKMTAGIICTGGNYLVKTGNGNSFQDTGIEPQDNDILIISNDVGRFLYQYNRNGNVLALGDGLDIKTVNPTFGNDQNRCFIKIGNDVGTLQISDISFMKSSLTYLENSKLILKKPITGHNVLYNDNLNANPIKILIDFGEGSLNTLLGFISSSETSTGVEFSFNATNKMSIDLFENDVVVELLQGNTDSYDHTYKTKRNIISVIPSGDIHNNTSLSGIDSYKLSYTEQYPVWISFDNRGGNLQFGQLTIRVSSGGSLLTSQGKITCALLFKDENDLMPY